MKFFIVDDDISVGRMVEEIVKDSGLGEVLGVCTDSVKALEECKILKPDVLLIDLLMPELDGITFVEHIKKILPKIKCVMISQVTSKKIIGEAYEGGVTFFVRKPINRKEIRHVLNHLAEQNQLENALDQIKAVLGGTVQREQVTSGDEDIKKFKIIFSKLGILGESGCEEIIACCDFIKRHKNSNKKLMDISSEIFDNPKASEQRIRRAINKGLTNIATIGVEDYLNDSFMRYSNTLYDFEQVRAEMEHIRGRSEYRGKINIKKFIDNLLILVEEI